MMNSYISLSAICLERRSAALLFLANTITPPVGSILFTGCKVGHVTIEQVIRELMPYFCSILLALLLVTYIPAISMALPTMAGLIK